MIEHSPRCCRSNARYELHHAEARDAVTWVFDKPQQSQDVSDVRGIEELEAAELDERNIPPRQLDFEGSTVMRGAEEDRLLLQRRSALTVLEHAIRDVASLIGFVAHADELRSRSGVSIGPEVLGEALSPQTDHAVCRREDRLGRAIVALKRDDFCRRAELGGEVEDVADGRGAKRIN